MAQTCQNCQRPHIGVLPGRAPGDEARKFLSRDRVRSLVGFFKRLDARYRVRLYISVPVREGEDGFQIGHAGVNRGGRPAFLLYIHLPAGEVASVQQFDTQVKQILLHY